MTPIERSRSHHPADRPLRDRRTNHPDLTKLQGWRSMKGRGRHPRGPLGRGSGAGRSAWASPVPTRSRTSRSPPSRGASCRIMPASTPSSRRPMPRTCWRWRITTPPFSASPSTAARPIVPVRGSGRKGCARSRRSTTPYNYEMAIDLREQMTLLRCRRRVHHPGEPGKELRPDQAARSATVFLRLLPGDDRRRPFHRLSLRARHRGMHVQDHRHRAFRPPRRHPGEGPRRADAHHAVVPFDEPAERSGEEPRAGGASAAGRSPRARR